MKNYDRANIISEKKFENLRLVILDLKERTQTKNAIALTNLFEECTDLKKSIISYKNQVK